MSFYPLLLFAGIIVSITIWSRMARRDSRLLVIYLAALVSAFIGAKLVYLLAEGWLYWDHPQRWRILATGKTVLGALLGGYLGVELAKLAAGYKQATGDLFAVVAPLGIGLGRIGCLLHGCCLGHACQPGWWSIRDSVGLARWPAAPLELAFNLLSIATFVLLRRAKLLPGQHFHLYLISYGIFRFAHEFLRETPRVMGPFSGYHFAAAAVVLLGTTGFIRRAISARSAAGETA
ncbi:MAG TPA: prolipoprotein diacylglyceryl transferase family protein [Chthoniobacteraceae bacterium]